MDEWTRRSTMAATDTEIATAFRGKPALDEAIQTWITRYGYRVESQSDSQAVIVRGHRPNHLLHMLLTILTAGFWGLFVWLPIAIFGGERRRVLTVDGGGIDSVSNTKRSA